MLSPIGQEIVPMKPLFNKKNVNNSVLYQDFLHLYLSTIGKIIGNNVLTGSWCVQHKSERFSVIPPIETLALSVSWQHTRQMFVVFLHFCTSLFSVSSS